MMIVSGYEMVRHVEILISFVEKFYILYKAFLLLYLKDLFPLDSV